jgi:peptidylprolyl isomerase
MAVIGALIEEEIIAVIEKRTDGKIILSRRIKVNGDISLAVKKGDQIKVEYTGSFDDGTIFDSSKNHKNPLVFEVGAKPPQVINGFDRAVLGMELDEEKQFRIEAADAYGEYNAQLLRDFPREQLPDDQEPAVGMVLILATQTGDRIHATINKVKTDHVTLDLNHPLAGKALNFKIKILEIISP